VKGKMTVKHRPWNNALEAAGTSLHIAGDMPFALFLFSVLFAIYHAVTGLDTYSFIKQGTEIIVCTHDTQRDHV
jgi:hypothetical protein